MKTNKTLVQISLVLAFGALAPVTQAAVFNTGDILTISSGVPTYDTYGNIINVVSGSWFGCDCNANSSISGSEKTPLSQGTTGIRIGYAQPPGEIDAFSTFFGNNTSRHFTASPVVGDTISGLDFTGWRWSYQGIDTDMGSGAWGAGFSNGRANITWDGIYGHSYVLEYTATVPIGDPIGFGGVKYKLHLEGSVNAVPIPAAVWLFGSGLAGLLGLARRSRKQA